VPVKKTVEHIILLRVKGFKAHGDRFFGLQILAQDESPVGRHESEIVPYDIRISEKENNRGLILKHHEMIGTEGEIFQLYLDRVVPVKNVSGSDPGGTTRQKHGRQKKKEANEVH